MIKLLKTDDSHKTISFCVLTPDIEDRNGDIISEEEIIKTAHEFGASMQDKYLNVDHEENSDIEKAKYQFVENFIAPNDIIIGEYVVKRGSWYIGIKFLDDELYEGVKSGDFVGVSMEGYFTL